MPHRREHPRISADVLVDYTGSEVLLYQQVEDISLGGLSIRTPTAEPVGTVVELSLNFRDFRTTVDLQGEVVWVNDQQPPQIGVRFSTLSGHAKDVIRRYIQLQSKANSAQS